MEEKDVIALYLELKKFGIRVWIDGGWGVDALLEEQTRWHKDLDIVILQEDLSIFRHLLFQMGFREIRLEIARSHNFVLGDNDNREIDVHVIELNDKGDGIYGPKENCEIYPAASLTGKGKIRNIEVECISAIYAVKFHSGYKLHEKDYHDVIAICKKFDLEKPTNLVPYQAAKYYIQ